MDHHNGLRLEFTSADSRDTELIILSQDESRTYFSVQSCKSGLVNRKTNTVFRDERGDAIATVAQRRFGKTQIEWSEERGMDLRTKDPVAESFRIERKEVSFGSENGVMYCWEPAKDGSDLLQLVKNGVVQSDRIILGRVYQNFHGTRRLEIHGQMEKQLEQVCIIAAVTRLQILERDLQGKADRASRQSINASFMAA